MHVELHLQLLLLHEGGDQGRDGVQLHPGHVDVVLEGLLGLRNPDLRVSEGQIKINEREADGVGLVAETQ